MAGPKRGALPPLPVPPRSLAAPERKAAERKVFGTFTLESKTPTRTLDTAQLGALVSVFEVLTKKRRDQLTALGNIMLDLSDEQADRLLDFAMNGLG